jgi:GT2 family glycosyltransferase
LSLISEPALELLPPSAPQIRHTVTAIVVAHDGARMLPGLIKSLRAQTYPLEEIVGVDTGSRDRSGAVLGELIGQDAVFGMPRSTGYAEAVSVAIRQTASYRNERQDQSVRRVEWIWLLHDDCEAAPDALERLLRAASKDRSVVVLGPKVLDGQDRRVLREVGVSIDRAGRRVTGIEPGEIDQGQHDHNRAVLAVGSAGMLVRRDVWDQIGGFDTRLKLFRDDIDFCWRVQGGGYRVQVVTDAVIYHRELSARRRRDEQGSLPRRLDRRNALWVLAVNLPLLVMLRVIGGCVMGSLIRAGYFLVTKQVELAYAQVYAIAGLFLNPLGFWQARRRRAAGRAEGYAAARTLIPPARTLAHLAEKIAGLLSNGPPQASAGRHQATVAESEEDAQFVDTQSLIRRVIGHPGVQLFTVLLLVALIAERQLLGTSPLGGGALVPAWGGSGALWHEYLASFHAVGVGSTASAPPYLAVVAGLATVLGGQAWLAVDVLLLGCVPLAGLTAYVASRWVASATPARVLLAASYALLPVATGAVAAGRLGTATAFILLPLIATSGGRMLTAAPRPARRAAWATGLLVGLAAAFAPLTWVLAVAFVLVALAARRWLYAFDPLNAAIVAATPFAVLFPWSLHLLSSRATFLTEAGVPAQGLTTAGLRPTALLALSPGGPGLPPVWVTAGLALAVLAALLPHGRTALTVAGWSVATAGLLTAVLLSRTTVTPPGSGQPAANWPGVALALAALGLLLAAAPAAQWLAEVSPNAGSRLFQRFIAVVTLIAAASAPLLVAGYWIVDGVQGPVGPVTAPLVPAFVSAKTATGGQNRTLILRPTGTGIDYQVVRQSDPMLGEPELSITPAAGRALSRQVAALTAPDGAYAGDPGLTLGDFGIGWVLMPAPVNTALAQRLDAAVGLQPVNKPPAYDLWQVTGPVARARVVASDGTVTPVTADPVGAAGATAPAVGGTLVLAEPFGGWTARLNGTALKPVTTPVDGWAQGFMLPAGGGKLTLTRNNLARDASLIAELLVVLAVGVLALPGKRADPDEETEALDAIREARDAKRAARSARAGAQPYRSGGRSGGRGSRRAAGRQAVAGLGAGLGTRFGAGRSGRRRAAGQEIDEDDLGPMVESGAMDDDAGQWDNGGNWDAGNQWDADNQWDQGESWDSPVRRTGAQSAAYDDSDQELAPWELPQSQDQWGQRDSWDGRGTSNAGDAWNTSTGDAWNTGDAWAGGSQPPAYLTGPQTPLHPTGPHSRSRRTGAQPAQWDEQAQWDDQAQWGEQAQWGDPFDAGDPAGRDSAAPPPARSERHSHRAGRHGRASRWRANNRGAGNGDEES